MTKLWKVLTIKSIKLLNKWDHSAGSSWLRPTSKSCPFASSIPSSGTVFSNSDQLT
jgi:hypothetical protein